MDRVGRSGGLAILKKNSFPCEVSNCSRNQIDVTVFDNSVQAWRLTCYYGYPEREKRKESWQFLCRLANISTLPWCIMGDFNDLLYAADKRGNNSHPQYLLDGFSDAIADCQLIELDLNRGNFTWEKGRGT